MVVQGKYNQALEQRSSLTLEFPKSYIRVVPFFENPEISESKKANYVKYSPLGRSSPILSYFGSDSRIIDLSFFITMDHIIDLFSKDLKSLTFPLETRVQSKLSRVDFTKRQDPGNTEYRNKQYSAAVFDSEIDSFVKKKFETINQFIQSNNAGKFLATDPTDPNALLDPESRVLKQKIIDYIIYWINLIRSTVVNNAIDPREGPPIVRLNHGILYMDIPTVCFSYKLDIEEQAGYDRNTLLPRRIRLGMQLVEVRHGDFGRFEPATLIKRDNITGWESIVLPNGAKTMDPIPLYRRTNDR